MHPAIGSTIPTPVAPDTGEALSRPSYSGWRADRGLRLRRDPLRRWHGHVEYPLRRTSVVGERGDRRRDEQQGGGREPVAALRRHPLPVRHGRLERGRRAAAKAMAANLDEVALRTQPDRPAPDAVDAVRHRTGDQDALAAHRAPERRPRVAADTSEPGVGIDRRTVRRGVTAAARRDECQ